MQMCMTILKTTFNIRQPDHANRTMHCATANLVYMIVQWSHRLKKHIWRNKHEVTTRHMVLLFIVQGAHNMTANTLSTDAVGRKSCYKLQAAHSV